MMMKQLVMSSAFVLHVSAELFSSMFGLEQLVITENGFDRIVEDYIKNEMERLDMLRKYVLHKNYIIAFYTSNNNHVVLNYFGRFLQ